MSNTLPAAPANTSQPGPGSTSIIPGVPLDLSHLAGVPISGMDRDQILNLLQSLPGNVLNATKNSDNNQETAAQILQSLANNGHSPLGVPFGPTPGHPDPGPSSHPRGPPTLNELQQEAAIKHQQQQQQQQQVPNTQTLPTQPVNAPVPMQDDDEPVSDGGDPSQAPPSSGGGRRSRSGAAMGSDEWTRQRKDNHKEVERRRRGNINDGINELGRIVPHGSGEKAKGAILSRAVQYIHHLKENEARNIEKWTLEKLLMDQAMGDLQSQLEECRKAWNVEMGARERLEKEVERLKGEASSSGQAAGQKRSSPDAPEGESEDAKRQRVE